MFITFDADLEAAINQVARQQGVAPEALAIKVLRKRFLAASDLAPRDEWERGLLGAAVSCGVSLPDAALTSEGIYD